MPPREATIRSVMSWEGAVLVTTNYVSDHGSGRLTRNWSKHWLEGDLLVNANIAEDGASYRQWFARRDGLLHAKVASLVQ